MIEGFLNDGEGAVEAVGYPGTMTGGGRLERRTDPYDHSDPS